MGLRLLSCALLALIGCYKPTFQTCELACASGEACPAGYACSNGRCAAGGAVCGEGPGDDAMAGDAANPGVQCDDGVAVIGELCYDRAPVTLGGTAALAADAQFIDMTNDGRRDLVVGTPSGLQWYAQDSAGQLATAVTSAASGTYASRFTEADLDEDGKPEVAFVDAGQAGVYSTGPHHDAESTGITTAPVGVGAGRLSPNALRSQVVYLYPSELIVRFVDDQFDFSPPPITRAVTGARSLAVGRLAPTDATAAIFVADALGVTSYALVGDMLLGTSFPTQQGILGIALGDIDGDNDLDLVLAIEFVNGNYVQVLRNDLGNGFVKQSTFELANVRAPITTVDVDGDGAAEVVVTSGDEDSVVTILGYNGALAVRKTIPLSQVAAEAIHAASFDGDGGVDFAITGANHSVTLVRSNN